MLLETLLVKHLLCYMNLEINLALHMPIISGIFKFSVLPLLCHLAV